MTSITGEFTGVLLHTNIAVRHNLLLEGRPSSPVWVDHEIGERTSVVNQTNGFFTVSLIG